MNADLWVRREVLNARLVDFGIKAEPSSKGPVGSFRVRGSDGMLLNVVGYTPIGSVVASPKEFGAAVLADEILAWLHSAKDAGSVDGVVILDGVQTLLRGPMPAWRGQTGR
jgi:hypothetical protein